MSNHIVYIGGFELPDKNAAAQRVVANAKILVDLGYKVTLIGLTKSANLDSGTIDKNIFYINRAYPNSFYKWLCYLTSIKYINNHITSQTKYIIAYNYPSLALYLFKVMNSKLKVIADLTEWYKPIGNIVFRTIKGLDVNFRMKFVNLRLKGLIVISDFLFEYYNKRGVTNIILLPPLIDKNDNKWLVNKINHIDNKIKLIFAGSVSNNIKDKLDKVISILIQIRDLRPELQFELRVIGITKNDYIKYFNLSDNSSQLRDFIHFEGRIEHKDAINKIANSDFQIFFRDNNLQNLAGFPTKFVESISCGTPVITNKFNNIHQYLNKYNCGFVIDIDDSELSMNQMIEILTTDRLLINELKNNCKYIDIFNYKNYNKKMIDFLRKIDDVYDENHRY